MFGGDKIIFLGKSFCSESIQTTPTNLTRVNIVTIKNGIYDELYITNEVESSYSKDIPKNWDFNTILHALFEENLNGGNVEFAASQIDSVRIKRRKAGNFNWLTLFEILITNVNDLKFERFDITNSSNVQYEYALIPCLNNVEGNINIGTIFSEFDGIFIVERDHIFGTQLDLNINFQKNHPSAIIQPLGRRYPYSISNGENNYYSGSVSGTFIEYKGEIYDWDVNGGKAYREKFMDFLCNGRPKILKTFDGHTWMICVGENPIESQSKHELAPTTSFEWTEVGSCLSSSNLYNNNFIDVDLEGT